MKTAAKISKVLNFDPESVRAPMLLRCAAFLIDYVLIILFPIVGLLVGRVLGNDGSKLLNSEISSFGWVLGAVFALADLILLPLYTCQSLGKMATGLRIVDAAGRPPGLGRLFLRHTVGYLVTAATLGIGFIIAAFGSTGRSLHDRICRTYVIFAKEEVSAGAEG